MVSISGEGSHEKGSVWFVRLIGSNHNTYVLVSKRGVCMSRPLLEILLYAWVELCHHAEKVLIGGNTIKNQLIGRDNRAETSRWMDVTGILKAGSRLQNLCE